MERIQLISILVSLSFLFFVAYLIRKGRLREEYSFIWIASTFLLIIFSFWRNGLEVMAHTFGVYAPPNLIFTGAIFAILVYLLHLSLTVSKLHEQNKTLSQELALLKEKLEQLTKKKDQQA
ncbi:MAG: DUF2304 domain-containing protein [Chitinophagales bacterium]